LGILDLKSTCKGSHNGSAEEGEKINEKPKDPGVASIDLKRIIILFKSMVASKPK
jgi:hypothetical protein